MGTTLLKSLTTKADIKEMIITDYAGQTASQVDDALTEITDGIMPIYYNDIIGEWQAMPGEYDGQGVAEFGLPEEPTVYNLMSLDLFKYYFDQVSEVFNELKDAGHFDEEEAE